MVPFLPSARLTAAFMIVSRAAACAPAADVPAAESGTPEATTVALDWPRFRGPNGSGVSDAVELPVEFGPEHNVAWAAEVPFGRSSPIVAGDRVYLTASAEDTLITMALDRAPGEPV